MKSSKKKEPATTASSSGKSNFPSSIADKTPIPKALPAFEAMKTENRPEGATVVAGFVLSPEEVAKYRPWLISQSEDGQFIKAESPRYGKKNPMPESILEELFSPLPATEPAGMVTIPFEELQGYRNRIARLKELLQQNGGQP